MSTPALPGTEADIREDTKRIFQERLATLDEDIKTARPAKEVIEELRKKNQPPAPC